MVAFAFALLLQPCALANDVPAEGNLTSSQVEARRPYRIPRIDAVPRVDGVIDDGEWGAAARIPVDIETEPGDNLEAEVYAEALLMEDGSTLFVAFIAEDPQPERIRAFYRDRDRAWSDDWMAISLDTFNDQRRAFEFFVNPLGVQMDSVFDDINRREDASWNAIWESEGRITERGYVVEAAIPLKQLRFSPSTAEQLWSVEVVRHYPRGTNIHIRSNRRDRDISCVVCQYRQLQGFANLHRSRNIEIIPTLTTAAAETRQPISLSGDVTDSSETTDSDDTPADGRWHGGDPDPEASLDLRWGITQDIYLNGTLNPDFSQVEADSARLDINNTFSLYFPERRTFFLDGADYFAGFTNLVHTRNIADPDYGIKLTGTNAGHAFGLLSADDTATSFVVPGALSSDLATLPDTESRINIARYRYDIFSNSSIGATVTDRRGHDYSNTVTSMDAVLRPSDQDTVYVQWMRSASRYPQAVQDEFQQAARLQDDSYVVEYRHSDRRWDARVAYEDWGSDFRADLGFINRVGYKFFIANMGHTWRWDSSNANGSSSTGGPLGLTRLRIVADYDRTEAQDGTKLEEETEFIINANGPMQSFLFGLFGGSSTYWDGKYFDERFNALNFGFSPGRRLRLFFGYRWEDVIDFSNSRLGESKTLRAAARFQWGRHLQLDLEQTRQEFDVEDGRLFTADLSDFRTTYQFDTRSFMRFTLQYSDNRRQPALYTAEVQRRSRSLTTQLLYSYKVNAATRFFIGYSGAGFQNDSYDSIERTDRTLFAKFSYAWLP